MPNTPRPTPAELSPSWPDTESSDPAGEAARLFVVNLRTAMGEKSIRRVGIVPEAVIKRISETSD